jgi:hypothetical protein
MKLNDLIHTEIIAIDGFQHTMLEKETGRTNILFSDDETLEVGDIIVHKVVEIGNTYGDQETYGTDIVEVIKKN